jgi:DNA-binding NarL/FixJ family response regulator
MCFSFILFEIWESQLSSIKEYPSPICGNNLKITMINTKVKSKNESSLMKLNKRVKGKISLLTNGLSAKEIAALMGTSVNTINNQKIHFSKSLTTPTAPIWLLSWRTWD